MTTEMQQLQIAFASTDGITVDGHFGSCEQFDIYTVDAESYQKVSVRAVKSGEGVEKNEPKVQAIADCHLMFCASIGGTPAARVIRAGIHPMKCKPINGPDGEKFPAIEEQLTQLQLRMQTESLPPWLAKITGQTETLSTRFKAMA